jgi:protein arginine kinase activator
VLANMHKGMTHLGKVPSHALERKNFHDRMAALEDKLKSAIKSERYEDAARLRDEIADLKTVAESRATKA